jgi:hypothetical protein
MAVQSPPAPPLPPSPPPVQDVTVTGSLEGWDGVLSILAAAVLLGLVLWPLVRAIARRIEAGAALVEARGELEDLQDRVRHLEASQPRLAELEERLDFAERLLAQAQTQPAALSRSGHRDR